MEKASGLELAARFSYITNRLRYCGPKGASKEIEEIFSGKADDESLRGIFSKYEGLYVYLDHIAKKHGLDTYDYDVIEAYYLGNKLLDDFSEFDNLKIILSLVKRGLPEAHAQKIAKSLPAGLVPHHSFNVFFVGVGKTTGSVPTTILTMNKCMISVGKVLKVLKNQLLVSVNPLVYDAGIVSFGESKTDYVEYFKPMFSQGIKTGDYVGIHWDFACKILDENEKGNLEKYTKKNLDSLNSASYFSSLLDSR